MFAYRGVQGAATHAANQAAQEAAAFIVGSGIPPTESKGKRGDFDQYWFMLHRESQEVCVMLVHSIA